MPKGGWHGKAVTGGFFFRIALLVAVRRGDPRGRPPRLVPHFIQCVIAKPVRTLAVAIRTPVPSAPLPKEGCHGEAVTGGFFFRIALLIAVRRGDPRGRPPGLAPHYL